MFHDMTFHDYMVVKCSKIVATHSLILFLVCRCQGQRLARAWSHSDLSQLKILERTSLGSASWLDVVGLWFRGRNTRQMLEKAADNWSSSKNTDKNHFRTQISCVISSRFHAVSRSQLAMKSWTFSGDEFYAAALPGGRLSENNLVHTYEAPWMQTAKVQLFLGAKKHFTWKMQMGQKHKQAKKKYMVKISTVKYLWTWLNMDME